MTQIHTTGSTRESGPRVTLRRSAFGTTMTRGLVTGLPNLVASGLLIVLPLIGRLLLAPTQYATWVLMSTVLTVSLVVDFGSASWLIGLTARGGYTPGRLVK